MTDNKELDSREKLAGDSAGMAFAGSEAGSERARLEAELKQTGEWQRKAVAQHQRLRAEGKKDESEQELARIFALGDRMGSLQDAIGRESGPTQEAEVAMPAAERAAETVGIAGADTAERATSQALEQIGLITKEANLTLEEMGRRDDAAQVEAERQKAVGLVRAVAMQKAAGVEAPLDEARQAVEDYAGQEAGTVDLGDLEDLARASIARAKGEQASLTAEIADLGFQLGEAGSQEDMAALLEKRELLRARRDELDDLMARSQEAASAAAILRKAEARPAGETAATTEAGQPSGATPSAPIGAGQGLAGLRHDDGLAGIARQSMARSEDPVSALRALRTPIGGSRGPAPTAVPSAEPLSPAQAGTAVAETGRQEDRVNGPAGPEAALLELRRKALYGNAPQAERVAAMEEYRRRSDPQYEALDTPARSGEAAAAAPAIEVVEQVGSGPRPAARIEDAVASPAAEPVAVEKGQDAARRKLEDDLAWTDERLAELRPRLARMIGEGDTEEYRTLRDIISVHEKKKRFIEARLKTPAAAGSEAPAPVRRAEARVAPEGALADDLRRVDDELQELTARTPRYVGETGEEAQAHRAKLAATEERKRGIEARVAEVPKNRDEIRRIDDQLAELHLKDKRFVGEGATDAYREHAAAIAGLEARRKALEERLGESVPDRSNEVTPAPRPLPEAAAEPIAEENIDFALLPPDVREVIRQQANREMEAQRQLLDAIDSSLKQGRQELGLTRSGTAETGPLLKSTEELEERIRFLEERRRQALRAMWEAEDRLEALRLVADATPEATGTEPVEPQPEEPEAAAGLVPDAEPEVVEVEPESPEPEVIEAEPVIAETEETQPEETMAADAVLDAEPEVIEAEPESPEHEQARLIVERYAGSELADIDLEALELKVRNRLADTTREHGRLAEEIRQRSLRPLRDVAAEDDLRQRMRELEVYWREDKEALDAIAVLRGADSDEAVADLEAMPIRIRVREAVTSLPQAERIFEEVTGSPSARIPDLEAYSNAGLATYQAGVERVRDLEEQAAENARGLQARGLAPQRTRELMQARSLLRETMHNQRVANAEREASLAAAAFILKYREEHLAPWQELRGKARPESTPLPEQEAVLAPLRGEYVDATDRLTASIRKDKGLSGTRIVRGMANALLGTDIEDRNVRSALAVVDRAVSELLLLTPSQLAAEPVKDVVARIAHVSGQRDIRRWKLGNRMMANLNMDSSLIGRQMVAAVEAALAYKKPLAKFATEMRDLPPAAGRSVEQEIFSRYVEREYVAQVASRNARLAQEMQNAGLKRKLAAFAAGGWDAFKNSHPAIRLGATAVAGAGLGFLAAPVAGGAVAGAGAFALLSGAARLLVGSTRLSREGIEESLSEVPGTTRRYDAFSRLKREIDAYEQAIMRGEDAAARGNPAMAEQAFEEAKAQERFEAFGALEASSQDIGRVYAAEARAKGRKATSILLAAGFSLFGTGMWGVLTAKRAVKPAPPAAAGTNQRQERQQAVAPAAASTSTEQVQVAMTPDQFTVVEPRTTRRAAAESVPEEEPAGNVAAVEARAVPAVTPEAVQPETPRVAVPGAEAASAVRPAAEAAAAALPAWTRGLTPEQVATSGPFVENVEKTFGISLTDPNSFGRLLPMAGFMNLDPAVPLGEPVAMRVPDGRVIEVTKGWKQARMAIAQNPSLQPRTPEELAMSAADFIMNRAVTNGSRVINVNFPPENVTQAEAQATPRPQASSGRPINPYPVAQRPSPVRTYRAEEMRNRPLDLRQKPADAPPAPPTQP